ncbi:MAG: protein YgfX [Gammaproteobacteria bacterium]|nr:protein YgfX [Gammaproteobacteria bacterium]
MSSRKSVAPLQLDIYGSSFLTFFILVLHALVLGVLFYLAIPVLALIGVAILLVVNAYRAIVLHGSHSSRQAVMRISWEDSGRWYLVRKSGEKIRVQLRGDTFLSPRLTVLNFKVPDRWFKQTVILARDNVNVDAHRRLRVRLRTKPQQAFE